jgi:type VII secretion protein EccB
MPSRQDQLHSYQFQVQRVVAALVMRDTDPAQSPFRRVAAATGAGVLVAALAIAAVAVYGVLAGGGGTDGRDTGAVIIEKESGARYVYLDDGRLHPVLNYASALLVVGSARPRTTSVSRSSLAGIPRGVPLGIPGAPDSLPARDRLLGQAWTVCSRPPVDASAGARAQSVLLLGDRPGGGRALEDAALLVATAEGEQYVVWQRRRYRVREPGIVLAAFGWDRQAAVPVASALVNALPAGVDLARIPIPDRGKSSSAVAGAKIGKVYVVESQSGSRQYAVALADGLAPVTQVEADLLLVDPDTVAAAGQHEAAKLGQGDYAAARKVALPAPAGPASAATALPTTTPRLAPKAATVCAAVPDQRGISDVRVDADVADGAAVAGGSRGGAVLVDRVVIPPGRGVVVEALASPTAQSGALSVVTDLGVRYPVAGPDVLAMLGYAGVTPVRLPAELVAMLPTGRALDRAVALRPVSATD